MRNKKSLNERSIEWLEKSPATVIRCRLGEILGNRGMTQTELSLLTGLRQASISDLVHNRKTTLNTQHLLVIMLALDITDLSEMIEIVMSEEVKKEIDERRDSYEGLGLSAEQRAIIEERKRGLE
jgi:predicted transcriptional regulator